MVAPLLLAAPRAPPCVAAALRHRSPTTQPPRAPRRCLLHGRHLRVRRFATAGATSPEMSARPPYLTFPLPVLLSHLPFSDPSQELPWPWVFPSASPPLDPFRRSPFPPDPTRSGCPAMFPTFPAPIVAGSDETPAGASPLLHVASPAPSVAASPAQVGHALAFMYCCRRTPGTPPNRQPQCCGSMAKYPLQIRQDRQDRLQPCTSTTIYGIAKTKTEIAMYDYTTTQTSMERVQLPSPKTVSTTTSTTTVYNYFLYDARMPTSL